MNNKKVGILGFLSGVLAYLAISIFTPLDYKARAFLGAVLFVVYLGFCYFTGLFKKDQS